MKVSDFWKGSVNGWVSWLVSYRQSDTLWLRFGHYWNHSPLGMDYDFSNNRSLFHRLKNTTLHLPGFETKTEVGCYINDELSVIFFVTTCLTCSFPVDSLSSLHFISVSTKFLQHPAIPQYKYITKYMGISKCKWTEINLNLWVYSLFLYHPFISSQTLWQ